MDKNFRTYDIAVEFYRLAGSIKLAGHLKDQLSRAASSIVLNLAEGSGRLTAKDQRKFFSIAYGSLRECRAVLDLSLDLNAEASECANKLGAHLYRLIQRAKGR